MLFVLLVFAVILYSVYLLKAYHCKMLLVFAVILAFVYQSADYHCNMFWSLQWLGLVFIKSGVTAALFLVFAAIPCKRY